LKICQRYAILVPETMNLFEPNGTWITWWTIQPLVLSIFCKRPVFYCLCYTKTEIFSLPVPKELLSSHHQTFPKRPGLNEHQFSLFIFDWSKTLHSDLSSFVNVHICLWIERKMVLNNIENYTLYRIYGLSVQVIPIVYLELEWNNS
jgi:hypothetical protein